MPPLRYSAIPLLGLSCLLAGCCTNPPDNSWMTAPGAGSALEAVNADMSHFDVGTAYVAALASDAAYLPPPEAQAALKAWGFHNPITLIDPSKTTQCCIASDRRFVLIAFKGSSAANFPDWWTNFDAQLVAVPELTTPGRDADAPAVYAGFSESLDSVWPDLLRAATDAATAGRDAGAPKPIWLTGHGRGGALATLAAFRLTRAGHHIAAVYTFGQPRVGNRAFSAAYESIPVPHYRVAHGDDPVVDLPRDKDRAPAFAGDMGTYVNVHSDGVISTVRPGARAEVPNARSRELMDSRVELLAEHHVRRAYLQSLYLSARFPERAERSEWQRSGLMEVSLPHPRGFDATVAHTGTVTNRATTRPATEPAAK